METQNPVSDVSSSLLNALSDTPLVFLFVNPTSGGTRASCLTSLGVDHMRIRAAESDCDVYIHDIRVGSSGQKEGFIRLRSLLETRGVNHSNPVRIMVAGGDGTVMWAMSEVMAHNIDVTKVAFGVIPFGTGNDFARSLGWGGSSPSGDIAKDGMKKFKRMVKRWLDASVCEFDVWEVSLHVDSETGRIRQVKDKGKVVMLKDEGRLTSLSKPMCNYFSMGLESRIGLGFDKKRQNSSFMNKMVYGWEGLKKTFMSTPRIDEVVESVDGGSGVLLSFSSDKTSPTCVKGSPVSLIFMNINSFAGGCDLWTNSKKLGTHQPSPELKEVSQSCGDGQLEVITYNSLPSLSAEQMKVFGGNGLRIAQEAGPVRIAFKKNTHKRSYMQIDGEFFTLDNPTHAEIVHKWKVNVLKGPKN